MNLLRGGMAPTMKSPAPESMTAAFPVRGPKPLCCIDTAKKIDTDVGGAMINGMFVRNAAIIQPSAQVADVAMIENCSSYPTLYDHFNNGLDIMSCYTHTAI